MKAYISRSILLSVFALSPLFALTGCNQQQDVQASGPPPSVTVVEASKKNVKRSASFTGRVEAVDAVDLTARVQGYLIERLIDEGADVAEGDLLFSIEKDNYIAEVDRVKGSLEKLRGAKRLATIERDRRAKLVKTKSISQEQLDIADANLIEVNGEIMSQKAALKRAELNLSYTEIKAPITGKMGISKFSKGDFVGPASGPMATVVSQDPSYVSFPISQRDLLRFAEEAQGNDAAPEQVEVRVKLADGSYYNKVGRLDFVDVVANPTTDTILVRAKFANPDGMLVHQQLVNVELQEEIAQEELTIPQEAIQFDQQGRYVLLVDETDTVVVQRIEVGADVDGFVVIKNGLSGGQKVITMGVQKVRPGIKVNANLAPGA